MEYGKVYRVKIEFNKQLFEDGKTFLRDVIPGVLEDEDVIKLESIEDNIITLIWDVPDREGVHEIENELFYALEDGKLGKYKCEFVS